MEVAKLLRSRGVSPREAEVLAALGQRLTNPEIADRLFVSKRTVESHVSALLRKLGATSRSELIAVAADLARPPTAPTVRFVDVDGSYVAWSAMGDGPPLLLLPHWTSNVETVWQEPRFESFARELSEVAQVIQFDKRGCGVSDGEIGELDDAVEDALAVLSDVGVDSAVVVAGDLAGFLAIRLAAAHPRRVSGLVLVSTTACLRRQEGYEIGLSDEVLRSRAKLLEPTWTATTTDRRERSAADAPFVEVAATYRRSAVRLSEVRRIAIYLATLDLREDLRLIACPSLVLHRRHDGFIPLSHGRYIADNIPGARIEVLPGAEQTMWAGDQSAVLDEILSFLAEGLARWP